MAQVFQIGIKVDENGFAEYSLLDDDKDLGDRVFATEEDLIRFENVLEGKVLFRFFYIEDSEPIESWEMDNIEYMSASLKQIIPNYNELIEMYKDEDLDEDE